MKVLITGGHVTPALAIIEKLQDKEEIVFVGRKYALDNEKTLSFEYKEIVKKNIRFIHLATGRVNRILSTSSILSIFKIPLGFYRAFSIIKTEKPDIILTFGSYIGAPIAFCGFLFSKPVFLHEQTTIPGRASRFISLFAKKVFISFPETSAYFPKRKVIVSGNPVRSGIRRVIKKPFVIEETGKPFIFITGGSLGSHSINLHIKELLPRLLKKYVIIHQVGDTKQYQDFEKLTRLKRSFPQELKQSYFLKKHFIEEEIGYIYKKSDLVIGRAGANTFFELLALEKPTIFIPLPWSGKKEQQKQAEIFRNAGAGEIFHQSETSVRLLLLIEKVLKNKQQYLQGFNNLRVLYNNDASTIIVNEILQN